MDTSRKHQIKLQLFKTFSHSFFLNSDKKGTIKHYHVHTNAENKLYLAENYCFDDIPKLIHYHQHNSAGNLFHFFFYGSLLININFLGYYRSP